MIKTAPTTGTGDQVQSYQGSGNGVLGNGRAVGTVTFYTLGLTGTYYYICEYHGSMVGSKNGSMIWNYTDKAKLTMKKFTDDELKNYLSKISDATLYAYNVYQIEGEGRSLFASIEGDEDTIMGLPVKKIKEYISSL